MVYTVAPELNVPYGQEDHPGCNALAEFRKLPTPLSAGDPAAMATQRKRARLSGTGSAPKSRGVTCKVRVDTLQELEV